MSHTRVTIPVRWVTEKLPDGCTSLAMYVNGTPAGTFIWDGDNLVEAPPGKPHETIETKNQVHV